MQTKTRIFIREVLYYNRTELITLNLFWIGFILYTAGWTLSKSTQVNFVICQLFQILGLIIFIPACVKLVRFQFSNEYQKIFFILLLIWSSITFLRGFSEIAEEGKDAFKAVIFDPWFGGFLYFTPMLMLFPKKLIYYKKVFDVIIILGTIYLFYDILFISNLMDPDGDNVLSRNIVEYFSKTLSVTAAFILLNYTYHSRPKLFYALLIVLVTIFFAMVRARRGLLIMSIAPLFFLYLLYFYNVKKKLIIATASVIILLIITGISFYMINQSSLGVFELISERGTEDTRSNVEKYFYADMDGLDWIIGRGMMGEYYSPTVGSGSSRGTIETDYLNMILKGGLISLALTFALLIPAAVLGIFFSRNTFSKAAGIWIVLWLINMYPSTVQVFTLNYIIVWIAVGICYSSTIRNTPEQVLRLYFVGKK